MVEYHKFVNAEDSAQAIEDLEGDVSFQEWKEVVAQTVNSGELTFQEKINLFGPPVEAFCTDPHAVKVVGSMEVKGVPEEDIRAHVDYLLEQENAQTFNRAIGIHVTSMENVDEILDKGIRAYKENADGDHSIRHKTVFFWVHSTDIDTTMHDYPQGIVVTAPVDKVKVSSFMNYELLASGMITADEYEKHHVMDYLDYVENVGIGHQASPAHGNDTLF